MPATNVNPDEVEYAERSIIEFGATLEINRPILYWSTRRILNDVANSDFDAAANVEF